MACASSRPRSSPQSATPPGSTWMQWENNFGWEAWTRTRIARSRDLSPTKRRITTTRWKHGLSVCREEVALRFLVWLDLAGLGDDCEHGRYCCITSMLRQGDHLHPQLSHALPCRPSIPSLAMT